ncbi:MAG: 50S ribosomal protein L24 [Coxiella sp. RIFCSPHIGHO2_12_FULL_42_15]|nr:MAG: 50S ribosomal protein L24 [Coxiella sp. RIFCSPHIGHO2_12_FULL_42_15]
MALQKIKVGDKVIVIAGQSKGRTGKVIRVLNKTNRLVVEGVNMVKKHVRPNPNKNEQGGILEREASIHISNVALLNPVSDKADRVGIKYLNDGRKVRYFKSNDEVIEN